MVRTRDRRVMDSFSQTAVLKSYLLEEIQDDHIPEGGRLPSERWLMEEFNVNRAVVRKVMSELSDSGMVERYQGKGTFRKSEPRRRERTGLIGVWFNWPGAPHWSPMVEAIRDMMSQQDYHCVFESGGLNRGDENRGICSLIRKGLDGFIVGPSSNPDDDHKPLMELIENKVPVVLIDRPFGNYEVDIVMSDLEMGAEEIVEHFHHLGHQKIAYLGVTGFSRTDERLDGYRSAMQRLDLKIYPQWIQEIERLSLTLEEEEASCLDIIVTVAGTRVSKRHCRNAVETLLRLPEADRPTAILTVNTTVAEMLGETLSEHNINIPEDIAVAAFSELSSKEMQGKGRLICYQQSNYRIGKYAARLLIDRIKTPDRGPTRILLPGRLIHPDSALPVRRML